MGIHAKQLSTNERRTTRIDKASQKVESPLAATLSIGTIQGLVIQSLLAGDMGRIRLDAPRVFAIYQRGIRSMS